MGRNSEAKGNFEIKRYKYERFNNYEMATEERQAF